MNLFKRTAKRIGSFFKFRHGKGQDGPIIQSETGADPALQEAVDQVSSELLALDPDRISEREPITGEAVVAGTDTPWSEDTLLAEVSGRSEEIDIDEIEPTVAAQPEPITYSAEPAKMVEAVFSPAPAGPAVEDLKSIDIDTVRPVIEQKPEPNISFTQLYELISGDVTRRSDKSVEVYERLLAATREELESSRRSNNIAWSVGGVMTAVAAFGGIWSASQIGATRNEVTALKNQVSIAQQTSIERQRITDELLKFSQASAKIEIDALKTRLDQAVSVSAERDRLRNELALANKVRTELQAELTAMQAQAQLQRVVSVPTTQPVSMAPVIVDNPLASAASRIDRSDRAVTAGHTVGAPTTDVWSMILNGR
jgi:hypothetical protein